MEQALTQFAVKILCDDSTGFDEVDDFFFATQADTDTVLDIENELD